MRQPYILDALSTNLDETYGGSFFFGVDVSANIHYDHTLKLSVVNRESAVSSPAGGRAAGDEALTPSGSL